MTLNGVMALTMLYFTDSGIPAFRHITVYSSIELIYQKSASITHRAVKFVCVTKFTGSKLRYNAVFVISRSSDNLVIIMHHVSCFTLILPVTEAFWYRC